MRAIVSGQIHQLWFLNDFNEYEHIATGQKREASSSSVLRSARLVSGTPFDLQSPTRSGGLEVLHLLQGMTVVDVDWLLQLDPEQFSDHKTRYIYDPRLSGLAEIPVIKLGKRSIYGESRPIMEHTHEYEVLFQREFKKWVLGQLEKQRINLERYHKKVPQLPRSFIEGEIRSRTRGIVSLHELESRTKREIFALTQLDTYMTDADRRHFAEPERSWRPVRKFRKQDRGGSRHHYAPDGTRQRRQKHWSKHRNKRYSD